MSIDERRFYSPKEVIVANGGILPMSLSSVYAAIAKGEIPVKTIGHRKLIPGRYLQQLLQYSEPAAAT